MSRGPYWMPSARWGARMGEAQMVDPVMGALTDPFHEILMGVTAENLAERGSISRERQDAFAVESHRRAAAARAEGRFDEQIVPAPVKAKRDTVDFTRDEHIREDVSPESMAKLPPVFKKDGTGLDEEKVNPNGGAIALGHPIGATGAAITTKLLDEMERRDLALGLVTLCIGGGQGIALLLGR